MTTKSRVLHSKRVYVCWPYLKVEYRIATLLKEKSIESYDSLKIIDEL